MSQGEQDTAVLYRMVMDTHICPYGLKEKHLLERGGYKVQDHWLTSREQTDTFKREHGVETTPQALINGERIGGYTDLRRHLGKPLPDPNATSYTLVLVVFATALGVALAASSAV